MRGKCPLTFGLVSTRMQTEQMPDPRAAAGIGCGQIPFREKLRHGQFACSVAAETGDVAAGSAACLFKSCCFVLCGPVGL